MICMDFKGYSGHDHIPYVSFEYIESVNTARKTATVIVRDMDAVLDHTGIVSHNRGDAHRFELKLTAIPKEMLDDYLKSLMAGKRLLAEKMLKYDELIKKIEEALAE